ncbi:uncharacterized protein LOC121759874 [Salvia splendens]|uniref:uncharacterized protein LOC121759874 n=1 Tax=Salvia splendens TaxID=180675 RepID=UPI001C26CBEE|nr:uncharacterized protein LOC121759874 [Salvia splendens]
MKPYPYKREPKRQKKDPTDFMEIFAKLEVNLSFLQALKLPSFSRFIKDFLAGKAKADGKIVIGEIYKRLTGVRLVDTKVVIQLANKSCISPEGVLENVLVRVQDFLYPADFHVIRMTESEAGKSSGVLLGRPFLQTAKTIIDVSDSTICLDYHGEKFTFNIDEAMKKPLYIEKLHSLDVIYPLVQEFLETELLQEQRAAAELNNSIEGEVAEWCETLMTQNLTDEEINNAIMGFCQKSNSTRSSDLAQLSSMEKLLDSGELAAKNMEKNPLPQDAISPKKELNTLPPDLKYVYLEKKRRFQ